VVDPVEDDPVVSDPVVTDPAPETTAAPEESIPPVEEVAVVDDATIQQQVAAVVGPDIGATVTNGIVLLTGQTDAATADASATAAGTVDGVQGVDDQILRLQAEEVCTDVIQAQSRWVCITSAEFDGTTLFAQFDFGFNEGDPIPNTDGGYHLHFFDGSVDDPIDAGSTAGGLSNGSGNWQIWDDVAGYQTDPFATFDGAPTQLCVEVANPTHSIENLDSGTCFPVTNTSGQNFSNPDVEAQVQVRRRVAVDSYVCTLD